MEARPAGRKPNHARHLEGKRIAIYTAIIGDYDQVHVPEVLLPGVDYVIFADQSMTVPAGFSVRAPEYHAANPVRTARYVKLHPHHLLGDYDYAVWIDANILVLGDITDIIADHIASQSAVGAVPHPERRSVYQEAAACLHYAKDDADAIREQVRRYDRLDFDCDDLIESNFMMFDLRSPAIESFLASWWSEIDGHSRRDQLSFNFAMRTNRLGWRPLIEAPHSTRSHPKFVVLPHGDETQALSTAVLEEHGARPVAPSPPVDASAAARRARMLAAPHQSIDIVICVKDALEDVRRCLESVFGAKARAHHRIVLVDDGSAHDTRTYLEEVAAGRTNIVLERNGEALGYTRAANQGLARSSADCVILLNSDTIVTDWWAEKLAEALFGTPGAGLVGPLSNAASFQSIPSLERSGGQTAINPLPPGTTPEDMNLLCETWAEGRHFPRVPLVHGFCFGIARQLIDRIGYFDDLHFPKGYGEENDYCFRATDAGFDGVVATDTFVFHAKTRSYTPADRRKLVATGSATLRELFGAARIRRATASMASNPVLNHMRDCAAAYAGP